MADADLGGGEGGAAKSKKKNHKRRVKKNALTVGGSNFGDHHEPEVDPMEELRQRLAEAKVNKDHGLASKLRQQLWIVQDLAAGVTPRVDPEDADGQALVNEFQRTGIISLHSQDAASTPKQAEKETATPAPVSTGGVVIEDKRLKNLNKKLKQIEALKEKQKKGEKLESNQLEKIKSEASVKQELREMEELISKISAEIKR